MKTLTILILAALLAGCTSSTNKAYERGFKNGRLSVEQILNAEVAVRDAEIVKLKTKLGFLPEVLSSKQPCCKFKKHEIQVGDPVKINHKASESYGQIRHVESIDGEQVTLCDGDRISIYWLSYAEQASLAACKEGK